MKINKKSICFISPAIRPLLDVNDNRGSGGAERQFYLFGKELSDRGWDVSYIIKKEKIPSISLDWCKIHPVNFKYLGGHKFHLIIGIISLMNAMRLSKASNFTVKTPAFLLLPMLIFSKLFNRKIIFWSQMGHDADPKRKVKNKLISKIQNKCLKKVDYIIAQTEGQSEQYRVNMNLGSTVIRNIASEYTSKATVPKKQNILWIGNSNIHKRQEIFLELCKLMPDYKFMMAMNIGKKNRFKMALKSSEKIPNLNFLGAVKQSETQNLFDQALIYIHTAEREGFPNTYLQACAGKTPIVSLSIDPDNILSKYNIGYCKNYNTSLEDEKTAIELAKMLLPGINKIISNKQLREELGANGFDYLKKYHSPANVVQQLELLLLKRS